MFFQKNKEESQIHFMRQALRDIKARQRTFQEKNNTTGYYPW
jgi:hypothetical protein